MLVNFPWLAQPAVDSNQHRTGKSHSEERYEFHITAPIASVFRCEGEPHKGTREWHSDELLALSGFTVAEQRHAKEPHAVAPPGTWHNMQRRCNTG